MAPWRMIASACPSSTPSGTSYMNAGDARTLLRVAATPDQGNDALSVRVVPTTSAPGIIGSSAAAR